MIIRELASLASRTPIGSVPKTGSLKISDGRYVVKVAETSREIGSSLRLRYDVFTVELSNPPRSEDRSHVEFDHYDFKCDHLIVVDQFTNKTVGTYRLISLESAGQAHGFYSNNEFTLEDLPPDVLSSGVEIGRACIAPEHRNTKVLFLLWKGLASYLQAREKRFFFGCCSIFTRDVFVGERAYRQLAHDGHFHRTLRVEPRTNSIDFASVADNTERVQLPNLFNMYLRIGAQICGPPTIDHDFGTIDFFVVCDTWNIREKYRRMFFS